MQSPRISQNTRHWKNVKTTRHTEVIINPCIRCPSERTFIAQRRLDGVVLPELPSVVSCNTKMMASNMFKLHLLFDSRASLILPAGSHIFLSHIVDRKTGHVVQNCNLRFSVIVRRCQPYRVQSQDLLAKCDLDNIWGSECTFSCGLNGKLSHTKSIFCNDDLQWIGEEPVCGKTIYI